MAEKPRYRALASIDPRELAKFQAGIRKRYTDEQIVAEIVACAERLGRSPTMREFAADAETAVHPQTVIEHFGSWNAAKRAAGLVPRRFATREELLGLLRTLGEELGRPPTARDIDEHKGRLPSKSLYWHTFGSLTNALREAGFDVPVGEERLERAVDQGVELAERLGRLPKFADWAEARREDDALMTEWQVYRMFDARRGAWSTFQFLVRQRLAEQGRDVASDGTLRRTYGGRPRSRRGARGSARSRLERARRAAPSPRRSSDRGGSGRCGRRGRPGARGTCRPAPRSCGAAHPLYSETISSAARVEAKKTSSRPRPSQSGRPTPRAAKTVPGSRWSSQAVAIEPASASSARGSFCECAASAKIASESTVIRGSERAQEWGASSSSSLTMIPLWIPTTGPCRTGWLLAGIDGWPFV